MRRYARRRPQPFVYLNAELSNSSALLALTALTSMRQSWLWDDYGDGDEIQEALAKAIDEIENGMTIEYDYVKIAETIVGLDATSVSVDNFISGNWRSYELIISGLKTNYTTYVWDSVALSYNDDTTITNYDTYARFMYNTTNINYQHLGTIAGNLMYWGAASSSPVAARYGNARIQFYDPLSARNKHMSYLSQVGGYVNLHIAETLGSGVYSSTDEIEKITITPVNGTTFKIDPMGTVFPYELKMSLYGRR